MTSQSQNNMIEQAIRAQKNRTFFAAYPENPKAYAEDANQKGLEAFQKQLNQNFNLGADESHSSWVGEEVSPYMMVGLGIRYPQFATEELVNRAKAAWPSWKATHADQRGEILTDALNRVSNRFFEIAYATMHTTGQSFVMSFQASGPHANDRALEVISLAAEELNRFDHNVEWVKPMGKFDLKIQKTFQPIPRGISLVIGCSTFPTWNTVPGLFASLMGGNPVIVKPHPKSILPIAIVIEEIKAALKQTGLDENLVQMAPDTIDHPLTKELAEHKDVKLIDYTGGSAFGDYIEALPGKITFTEKAGVNSVILDSVSDAQAVFSNIAFSTCLFSGQMCTAPQNIFVPADGITTADGKLSFEEVVAGIAGAIKGLVENPKMGPYTLGAVQNDLTVKRVDEAKTKTRVALDSIAVVHPEFPDARMKSPVVMVVDATETGLWMHECFGPALFVVKTQSSAESLNLAARAATELGAITCLCFSTDDNFCSQTAETMNAAFTPVSFNFTGAAFVNQHAAFSDFHVSGGNPSGNAGFTTPEYVNRRFVWVGNRYL
jgi:phenylacetic acid degradation protein paaN